MPRKDNSNSRPPRVAGSGPFATWAKWVEDQLLNRGVMVDVPGLRFQQTTNGIVPILSRQFGGGGAPVSVNRYLLQSVQGDYLTCQELNSAALVYVAKEQLIRNSLTQEIIEGVLYNYTYEAGPATTPPISNTVRVATVGGTLIERCIVTPEWAVNQEVWAIQADTGLFRPPISPEIEYQPITLLMFHSRHWALKA
jgi:hypothetical protein